MNELKNIFPNSSFKLAWSVQSMKHSRASQRSGFLGRRNFSHSFAQEMSPWESLCLFQIVWSQAGEKQRSGMLRSRPRHHPIPLQCPHGQSCSGIRGKRARVHAWARRELSPHWPSRAHHNTRKI